MRRLNWAFAVVQADIPVELRNKLQGERDALPQMPLD